MSRDVALEGRLAVPIYYEDTDLSGYVFHPNYLKYCDRAREELIGRRYLSELYARGVHFVVARVQISYLLPARHGDEVWVATRMTFAGPVITAEHTVLRPRASGGDDKLATATVKLAAVDSAGRITDIPADVLTYMQGRPPLPAPAQC